MAISTWKTVLTYDKDKSNVFEELDAIADIVNTASVFGTVRVEIAVTLEVGKKQEEELRRMKYRLADVPVKAIERVANWARLESPKTPQTMPTEDEAEAVLSWLTAVQEWLDSMEQQQR